MVITEWFVNSVTLPLSVVKATDAMAVFAAGFRSMLFLEKTLLTCPKFKKPLWFLGVQDKGRLVFIEKAELFSIKVAGQDVKLF